MSTEGTDVVMLYEEAPAQGEQKRRSRSVSQVRLSYVLYEGVSLNHSSITMELRTIKHLHSVLMTPSSQSGVCSNVFR